MKLRPASPANKPARRIIVSAVLMTTQAGQGEVEVADGEIAMGGLETPSAEHGHVLSGNRVTGRSLIRIGSAAGIPQGHEDTSPGPEPWE